MGDMVMSQVQNIDMEKHRMREVLSKAAAWYKQIQDGCDGRCPLGECICPPEGWEDYNNKIMAKEILARIDTLIRAKKGLSAIREFVEETYLKGEKK
jgi:hypothetical protein